LDFFALAVCPVYNNSQGPSCYPRCWLWSKCQKYWW